MKTIIRAKIPQFTKFSEQIKSNRSKIIFIKSKPKLRIDFATLWAFLIQSHVKWVISALSSLRLAWLQPSSIRCEEKCEQNEIESFRRQFHKSVLNKPTTRNEKLHGDINDIAAWLVLSNPIWAALNIFYYLARAAVWNSFRFHWLLRNSGNIKVARQDFSINK